MCIRPIPNSIIHARQHSRQMCPSPLRPSPLAHRQAMPRTEPHAVANLYMRHVLECRGMLHMSHRRAAAAPTTEGRRREGRLGGGGRGLDIQAFLFLCQTVAAAVVAAGRGAVHAAPAAASGAVVADLNVVVGSHLLDALAAGVSMHTCACEKGGRLDFTLGLPTAAAAHTLFAGA